MKAKSSQASPSPPPTAKAEAALSTSDIYREVTDAIVQHLEQGVVPWAPTWTNGRPAMPLRHSGERYQGINVLLLWMAAGAKGCRAPYWMTYKQAAALGGQVRKGEKATRVTYSGSMTKLDEDGRGEPKEREIRFLKAYAVFNVEQIDGLPAHFYAHEGVSRLTEAQRVPCAEAFFACCNATITTPSTTPSYNAKTDIIGMPTFASFRSADAYYATLAHEFVHWTAHPSRLGRELGSSEMKVRAMEELTAEIGAAFTCATLGLKLGMRDDHAPYIASWLKALQSDKRFIFTAASLAQKAVDFLHDLQPAQEVQLNDSIPTAIIQRAPPAHTWLSA